MPSPLSPPCNGISNSCAFWHTPLDYLFGLAAAVFTSGRTFSRLRKTLFKGEMQFPPFNLPVNPPAHHPILGLGVPNRNIFDVALKIHY